jgi:hypothetical protein
MVFLWFEKYLTCPRLCSKEDGIVVGRRKENGKEYTPGESVPAQPSP